MTLNNQRGKANSLTEDQVKELQSYFKREFGNSKPDPKEVLALAKEKKNPLHSYFEWDDKKAAEGFRLIQAEDLIRVVVVDEITPQEKAYSYVRLVTPDTDNYFGVSDNAQSLNDQILPAALGELNQWKAKYQNIKELETVNQAIEALNKELEVYGAQEKIS